MPLGNAGAAQQLPGHGVLNVAAPWAREGSGFTLLFEALTMLLCRDMPMAAVAEGLGEHDTRLFLDFKQRFGLAFSNPDETSRKGLRGDLQFV